MTLPGVRVAAWGLLAAGVAMATIAPNPDAAVPLERSGYELLTADFHVHAFPGDGALAPWDLRREARRRGLDVIAVTNHNQMLATRLDRLLFPEPPTPLTLAAEELTAPGFHVAAIGITEPVDWRLPLPDAIRAIHAMGGIAIAAHPVGRLGREFDDEVLALIDGIEVAHPVRTISASARRQLDEIFTRAARVKPNIAAIGASDFHAGPPLGSWRTVVFARGNTQEAILEAVRTGRTVAVGEAGEMFGAREWLEIARNEPVAVMPPANSPWHLIGAAAAWLSLVILVTLGGSPFRLRAKRFGGGP